MHFCPRCGHPLKTAIIDQASVKQCDNCQYIDWNNWVNVSSVVVAFTNNNEFILVKLKGKEAGKLTFPGGYRDLGETLEAAAIREFREETGMQIHKLELFKTYTKDEQRLVWIVYKAQLDQIKFIENDEVSELVLVSKDKPVQKEQLRGILTEKLYNDVFEVLSSVEANDSIDLSVNNVNQAIKENK